MKWESSKFSKFLLLRKSRKETYWEKFLDDMKTSSLGWNLSKILSIDVNTIMTTVIPMVMIGRNSTPQSRETLMLYSLSIDEGHRTTKLVVEEPQSLPFLDVRVESRPVRTVHLCRFCSTFRFYLQNYHLVALGGIPVVHLLDPVERLDGGELVGVALSCVHRVHRQVLLQRRVLLEE